VTVWPYLAMHIRTALWITPVVVALVLVAWMLGARFPALRRAWVDRIVMPLIVLAYDLGYLAWGEKVSHQGGFGWDGIRFAAWAKDFHKLVLVDRVNHYYLQKSLPSAVVHYGMRAVGATFTDAHVILGFTILDIASWTLTAVIWTRIAKMLDLSRPAAWLGFVVLFLNHAAMKHYLYNTVLVDSMGLLIAALMLHAHLARRPWLILPLAFIGGFVVPGLLPLLGGLFLLFERREMRVTVRPTIGLVIALSGAFAVVWAAFGIWDVGYWIGNGAEQVVAGLVPLSLVGLAVVLTMLCAPLASHWPSIRDFGRAFQLRWTLGLVLVTVAIGRVVDHYKNTVTDVTADAHYRTVLLLAIAKPLVFVVAHTAFLGPAMLLCLVMRKELGRAMWKLGPSMALVTAAGFVLATDSESRHILFFMPVLATGLAMAFDALGGAHRRGFVLFVAVLALFLSKAWLPHETPPLAQNFERLFMSLGPWMTLSAYGMQGAATVVAGILFQRAARAGSSLPS
jgi:hypothetical protein